MLPAWPALLSWSPAPQGTEREPLPSISRPGGSTPLGTTAHPPGCGVTSAVAGLLRGPLEAAAPCLTPQPPACGAGGEEGKVELEGTGGPSRKSGGWTPLAGALQKLAPRQEAALALAREPEKPKDGLRGASAAQLPAARERGPQSRASRGSCGHSRARARRSRNRNSPAAASRAWRGSAAESRPTLVPCHLPHLTPGAA